MNRSRVTSVLLVVLLSSASAFASTCPEPVGTWPGGQATAIAVSGKVAYITLGYQGFAAIDVLLPSHPTACSMVETPGYAISVAVSGDHALVADFDQGLRIIDISSPSSLEEVGVCAIPGDTISVTVSGTLAIAGSQPDWSLPDAAWAVHLIDFSQPTDPTEIGSCNVEGIPSEVAVAGEYVYVAGGARGIAVIDISDPSAPFLEHPGDELFEASVDDVVISRGYLFAVGWHLGLDIYNLASFPARPPFAGHYRFPDRVDPWGVTVSGRYAYVLASDGHNGPDSLRALDISDPAEPVEVGVSQTDWNGALKIGELVAGATQVYVAHAIPGLAVFDACSIVGSQPRRVRGRR